MEIHGRQWKRFNVKAPKGLKGGQVYKIDFNTKGLPKDIIPVLDTFITCKSPEVHRYYTY